MIEPKYSVRLLKSLEDSTRPKISEMLAGKEITFPDLAQLEFQRKMDAIVKLLTSESTGYTGIDDRHKRLREQTRPNHTAPQRQTLTFFRVEDAKGDGPYRTDVDFPETNGRNQHPLPDEDGIDWWHSAFPSRDYFFGFSDLEDLHGWFEPDALARLINARNQDHGFRVTEYAVETPEKIIHGYRQAIAMRADLRYVGTIDIQTLI